MKYSWSALTIYGWLVGISSAQTSTQYGEISGSVTLTDDSGRAISAAIQLDTSDVPPPIPSVSERIPNTHIVAVGRSSQLLFDPIQVQAEEGDTIVFQFFRYNHSVTESSLDRPCEMIPGGFNSGFGNVNSDDGPGNFVSFNVPNTLPRWFYCAQNDTVDHCNAGMVFAVNPGGSMNTFLDGVRGPGSAMSDLNSSSYSVPVELTSISSATTFLLGEGTMTQELTSTGTTTALDESQETDIMGTSVLNTFTTRTLVPPVSIITVTDMNGTIRTTVHTGWSNYSGTAYPSDTTTTMAAPIITPPPTDTTSSEVTSSISSTTDSSTVRLALQTFTGRGLTTFSVPWSCTTVAVMLGWLLAN